jgi:hypothetical protein
MNCDGCGEAPRYMLYETGRPHCEICYKEALEGCTVPILVISYEAWEAVMRLNKPIRRIAG